MAQGIAKSDRTRAPKRRTVSATHEHAWSETFTEHGATFRACQVKACRMTQVWNAALGTWI